jgi:plastocyanin
VGAATNGFDTECLATLPGQAFTVTFVNDDEGVPHNWSLYTDDSAAELLAGPGDTADAITGPDETTYDADPLDEGEYFYRCDLHPAQMIGTLIAVTVEGGGGASPEPDASPTA